MMKARHFLLFDDLSLSELKEVLQLAQQLKSEVANRSQHFEKKLWLKGKTLALIFEKNSTRTRVSFEVGAYQLGGNCIFLNPQDAQIARGESITDTARVLSSMADGIVARVNQHQTLAQLAQNSQVPVISALSDQEHPCQLLADILTLIEVKGSVQGLEVVYLGDGNNVCHSWMSAADLLGFNLKVITPKRYEPFQTYQNKNHTQCFTASNTDEIIPHLKNCEVVVTDCWVSMGQDVEKKERLEHFQAFQVNQSLLSHCQKDAVVMHCLPAYRGLEITDEVIDGKQSVVWQQAENRLHAQKGLLAFLFQ